MYTNYGDKNFFEYGVLVDSEHSDTSVDIIWCMPYCDEEDAFQFAECQVDTTDSWLEKDAVMSFIGMTTDTFDLVQFAIGCIEYYGIENFSSPYDGYKHDRQYIENILKNRLIASDNLNITWQEGTHE